MSLKYILALDQGTTSSRAILFDENQNIVSQSQREFSQIYPKEGWVEHDPMEIWSSQYSVAAEAVAKSGIDARHIAAVGITNQRETTIVWDRETGKPVYNAIVWQCRRTAPLIEEIKAKGLSDMICEKTGLIPDAYFSASKIRWILDNAEDIDGVNVQKLAEQGRLIFGTVDSWLIWKLTNGQIHATDRTNASRTMLYNIQTGEWDDELLTLFNIPKSMLPAVKSSGDYYGVADICGAAVPITGVAGDQQAALFGQGCFNAGDAKNTYGTGCFLLMNTGSQLRRSENGLVTTVAATLSAKPVQYVLEGSVFVGGAVIQWLRDEMRLFSESRDAEYFSRKVDSTGGVYLVPAFTGLGAPYWDMYARGAIVGITRGTKREHIIRAAQESIAYQSADLFTAMEKDSGVRICELKADGGASKDSFLMQFQSDILDRRVIRPLIHETTALGAAYLAGLTAGVWQSEKALLENRDIDRIYEPDMTEQKRAELLAGWHKAVGRSAGWANGDN